jgi:hypothetical protein
VLTSTVNLKPELKLLQKQGDSHKRAESWRFLGMICEAQLSIIQPSLVALVGQVGGQK